MDMEYYARAAFSGAVMHIIPACSQVGAFTLNQIVDPRLCLRVSPKMSARFSKGIIPLLPPAEREQGDRALRAELTESTPEGKQCIGTAQGPTRERFRAIIESCRAISGLTVRRPWLAACAVHSLDTKPDDC